MKSRYIMAFAAAALIFSGCQKNELSGGANEGVNDGWLKFRLSGLQVTKGSLINTEAEMLAAGVDEFTVQAWNADYSDFVTKQTVTYTDSKWQTASPIAWTGTDSKTFFASANLPASGATVTNTCTSAAQKQTLEYTLPLDARKQNDVMLGWYKGNGGGEQTADITFVHPLSSIILKKGEMEIDGIKKITVSGLYASGTVDVTYASGVDGVVPSYDWGSTRTGSVVSTLTPAEGAQYISVGEDGIIGTPFIVIPQTVAANQVKITVTATVNGADKNLIVNVPAGEFKAGATNVFTLGYVNPAQVHFIDLGLPSGTLWADRNVGAESETDPGDHFAWGEIEPKTNYILTTYKHYSSGSFTKYNATDNLVELQPSDDVAAINVSGSHIPTRAQFEELINSAYTTCTWVADYNGTGINGMLVTSNSNGNSIFLPAAGLTDVSSISLVGTNGCYWSSTLNPTPKTGSDTSFPACAIDLDFSNAAAPDPAPFVYKDDDDSKRFTGQSIRAVKQGPVPMP